MTMPLRKSLVFMLWAVTSSIAPAQPHLSARIAVGIGDVDGPVVLAIADFDDDGKSDIAVNGTDSIHWFRRTGELSGQFEHYVIAENEVIPSSLIATDFNADGRPDLVWTSGAFSGDFFTIRMAQNLGGNPPQFDVRDIFGIPIPDPMRLVGAADLDGDGDIDLYAGTEDTTVQSGFFWFENDGEEFPTFPWRIVEEMQEGFERVRGLAHADLDDDGDLDLIASWQPERVSWYENIGPDPSGFLDFIRHDLPDIPFDPHRIRAADVDGDGDPDIVGLDRSEEAPVWWHENLGGDPLSFQFHAVPDTNDAEDERPIALQTFDVDDDGDIDFVSGWGESLEVGDIRLHENLGGTPVQFRTKLLTNSATTGRDFAAGDIDGDGDSDLAISNAADDVIWWLRNDSGNPDAVRFLPRPIETGVFQVGELATGDFDDDNRPDILWTSFGANSVRIHQNLPTVPPAFIEQTLSNTENFAGNAVPVDLDGDGDLDVVSAARNAIQVRWYENLGPRGSPDFKLRVIDTNEDGPEHVAIADFDQDGDPDIAVALGGAGANWYENRLAEGEWFALRQQLEAGVVWVVEVGDVNGDGAMDILTQDRASGPLSWYQNLGGQPVQFDGTGKVIQPIIFLQNVQLDFRRFTVIDIDGDGDNDVVSGNKFDMVEIFKSDGARVPNFSRLVVDELPTSPSERKFAVIASDVDSDGDLDIVTATAAGDARDPVRWHENLNGDATEFVTHIVHPDLVNSYGATVADFDLDGDMDIAAGFQVEGFTGAVTLVWYENQTLNSNDLTGDGILDGADLAVLLGNWGRCSEPCAMDLNGDGIVNGIDIAALLASWGG